jgi:hypothetical protein
LFAAIVEELELIWGCCGWRTHALNTQYLYLLKQICEMKHLEGRPVLYMGRTVLKG